MSEAERILTAGRVKDEEGKLDEAFALYQQGMEMLMDKLKREILFLYLFPLNLSVITRSAVVQCTF